jgi:hypothetical protein
VLAFRQGKAYENADGRNPYKQAGYALDAARNVLETIIAEKKVAASVIDEAEGHLQSTHRMNAAAEKSLALLEGQLGDLMEAAYWIRYPGPLAVPSYGVIRPPHSSPSSRLSEDQTPGLVISTPAVETPTLTPSTSTEAVRIPAGTVTRI